MLGTITIMPNTPKLILDCDPGHDDAIAIMVAAQHSDLLGITAVGGNVALPLTTHNALITAQILGLDVPVFAGADRPLVAEPKHAEFIHGETGLGGPELPELTRTAERKHAVDFIIETVRSTPEVWLIPTGPLTNIALALRHAPDIASKVAGIAIMGGGQDFGNVTVTAEFNIWHDPEAADVVFRSGAPVIMCGLDLTHQFTLYEKDITMLRHIGNDVALFATDMLEYYSQAYANKFFGVPQAPLHDPCAVMTVTHPDMFTFKKRHVDIELHGTFTRGMTVVDRRGVREEESANVNIAETIDSEAALALLKQTLEAY